MKTCTKCHETKPLEEFSSTTQTKDGRHYHCKACRRRHAREYRKTNQYREVAQAYNRSQRGKDAVERYRKKNPHQRRAHRAVHRCPGLKIVPCAHADDTCSGQIEAHHDDYSKPLEVTFLCRRHHAQLHRLKRGMSR